MKSEMQSIMNLEQISRSRQLLSTGRKYWNRQTKSKHQNQQKEGFFKMALPKDPYILLSYLNTQLRDKYASLAALCDDLEEDQAALEAIMQTVQYHYDVNRNQFIHNS